MCTQERTYSEYSLFLDWEYLVPCSQVTLEKPPTPRGNGQITVYGLLWYTIFIDKYSKWFIFPFLIFWERGAHVCVHVCMGSTHVWVHVHMFVHACAGLKLMPGLILDCSSTLFEEAGCLSQAQSSLIVQDSLASSLWGSFVSTSLGGTYRWTATHTWHFRGVWDSKLWSSCLRSMHLNHGAFSPAQKMNFNRQSYKVTMSLYWNVTAIIRQRSSLTFLFMLIACDWN